jgi:hypothetical protein
MFDDHSNHDVTAADRAHVTGARRNSEGTWIHGHGEFACQQFRRHWRMFTAYEAQRHMQPAVNHKRRPLFEKCAEVETCLGDVTDEISLCIGPQRFERARAIPIVNEASRSSSIATGSHMASDLRREGTNLIKRFPSIIAGCFEHMERRRLVKRKAGYASWPLDRDPQRDASAIRMTHKMNGAIPGINKVDEWTCLISKLERLLAAPMRIPAAADQIRGSHFEPWAESWRQMLPLPSCASRTMQRDNKGTATQLSGLAVWNDL